MTDNPLCLYCCEMIGRQGGCKLCGPDAQGKEVPKHPSYLPPGTLLDDTYIIGRVLGAGGFGITYLGVDKKLNNRVAIKEYLPRELAARDATHRVAPFPGAQEQMFQKGLTQFLEEGQILAQFIGHPHIVPVIQYFSANETGYLVMRYLEGRTLNQLRKARGGKLPERDIIPWMIQTLRGLQEIHQVGIIHRDIKPANLYVTMRMEVKILDFGIAKYALEQLDRTFTQMGTDGYAPPEQLERQTNQGPWTDIYAVGATCYKLLTGETPPPSLFRLSGQQRLVPPREALGELVSTEFSEIILKAMALQPPARYQSASEMIGALMHSAPYSALRPGTAMVLETPSGPIPAAPMQAPLALHGPVGANPPWLSQALVRSPKRESATQSLHSGNRTPTPLERDAGTPFSLEADEHWDSLALKEFDEGSQPSLTLVSQEEDFTPVQPAAWRTYLPWLGIGALFLLVLGLGVWLWMGTQASQNPKEDDLDPPLVSTPPKATRPISPTARRTKLIDLLHQRKGGWSPEWSVTARQKRGPDLFGHFFVYLGPSTKALAKGALLRGERWSATGRPSWRLVHGWGTRRGHLRLDTKELSYLGTHCTQKAQSLSLTLAPTKRPTSWRRWRCDRTLADISQKMARDVKRTKGHWLRNFRVKQKGPAPAVFSHVFVYLGKSTSLLVRGAILQGSEWDGSKSPRWRVLYGLSTRRIRYINIRQVSYLGKEWMPLYGRIAEHLADAAKGRYKHFTAPNQP